MAMLEYLLWLVFLLFKYSATCFKNYPLVFLPEVGKRVLLIRREEVVMGILEGYGVGEDSIGPCPAGAPQQDLPSGSCSLSRFCSWD